VNAHSSRPCNLSVNIREGGRARGTSAPLLRRDVIVAGVWLCGLPRSQRRVVATPRPPIRATALSRWDT
jgi:hypothetical protein